MSQVVLVSAALALIASTYAYFKMRKARRQMDEIIISTLRVKDEKENST